MGINCPLILRYRTQFSAFHVLIHEQCGQLPDRKAIGAGDCFEGLRGVDPTFGLIDVGICIGLRRTRANFSNGRQLAAAY
jgi:hypothetical protein